MTQVARDAGGPGTNPAPTSILSLVRALTAIADGTSVTIALPGLDAELVRAWCDRTGNTLVAVQGEQVTVRRGRAPDPVLDLPAGARPGARLWIYTNFDCNLACDYCCVSSSPRTPRRALGLDSVRRLATEATDGGVLEILLTGGEPFLLPEIDRIAASCAEALPTTLLTNGMLFRGRRLELLRRLPREVRLQISLDSAAPDVHDAHRGRGSWARAVEGIRTALAEGFPVRVAATLTGTTSSEERELRAFLDDLGIPRGDQILRPVARQGVAAAGVALTEQTLIPEVTVTADGAYWHPVTADDARLLISRSILPLAPIIAAAQARFRQHRLALDAAARAFPCA